MFFTNSSMGQVGYYFPLIQVALTMLKRKFFNSYQSFQMKSFLKTSGSQNLPKPPKSIGISSLSLMSSEGSSKYSRFFLWSSTLMVRLTSLTQMFMVSSLKPQLKYSVSSSFCASRLLGFCKSYLRKGVLKIYFGLMIYTGGFGFTSFIQLLLTLPLIIDRVIHVQSESQINFNFICLQIDYNQLTIGMSSTFKNRIPKRKYRERSQVKGRQHLGLLEKKKDYKERAKNYHEKQDKLKLFKQKAQLKNQDEFYFKMLKSKKNEDGKIELDSDDSDFDEKQFRAALKTQNYNIVKLQKSIVEKKIQRLRADLHMIETEHKPNTHKVFVNSEEQLQNFQPQKYFNTPKQLVDKGILQYNPDAASFGPISQNIKGSVKAKYQRLSQMLEKQEKLTKLLLTIGYEKNLQGKERSKIKKYGKKKIHKFFLERKK